MAIYVAEIKGRGIAAFHADTGPLAELFVRDPAFCDDLMVLASDGLPLWDGMTSILVRQARPGEEAKWRASRPRRSDTAISRAKTTRGSHSLLHLAIPTEEKGDERAESSSLRSSTTTIPNPSGGTRRALQKSALTRS